MFYAAIGRHHWGLDARVAVSDTVESGLELKRVSQFVQQCITRIMCCRRHVRGRSPLCGAANLSSVQSGYESPATSLYGSRTTAMHLTLVSRAKSCHRSLHKGRATVPKPETSAVVHKHNNSLREQPVCGKWVRTRRNPFQSKNLASVILQRYVASIFGSVEFHKDDRSLKVREQRDLR